MAQCIDHLEARPGNISHANREEAEAVPPRFFCHVHGLIRVSDQVLRRGRILREEGDADAAGNINILLEDSERLGQFIKDLLCQNFNVRGLVDLGQDHREFIATDARDRIRAAHTGTDSLCRFAQQLVSGVMAKPVIDFLEAIEINKQQRQRQAGAGRVFDFAFQPVAKQAAVRQAGQRVKVCASPDLLFRRFAFGHVMRGSGNGLHLALIAHDRYEKIIVGHLFSRRCRVRNFVPVRRLVVDNLLQRRPKAGAEGREKVKEVLSDDLIDRHPMQFCERSVCIDKPAVDVKYAMQIG